MSTPSHLQNANSDSTGNIGVVASTQESQVVTPSCPVNALTVSSSQESQVAIYVIHDYKHSEAT